MKRFQYHMNAVFTTNYNQLLPDYQTECECDTYPDCNCKPIDKLLRERYEEEKDTE